MLSAIFVSYRRNDSQGEAGRLFDDLISHFGEQKVFMDVAGIEAGRDFRKAIEESVANCGVVLVIMGPTWLTVKNEAGTRRLDDPGDFVREEVASALRRDIPVIPVLVRGAQMPHVEELPESLKELAFRNCVELTHARWRSDVQLLIEPLRRLIGYSGEADARSASGEVPASAQAKSSSPGLKSPPQAEELPTSRFEVADMQRIRRELAVYIGPIAELVIARAVPLSGSLNDLVLKAGEEIESPKEREEFLRKMNSPTLLHSAARVPLRSELAPAQTASSAIGDTTVHRFAEPSPVRTSSRSRNLLLVMIVAGAAVLVLGIAIVRQLLVPAESGSHRASQGLPYRSSQPGSSLVTGQSKSTASVSDPEPPPLSRASVSASGQRVSLEPTISRGLLTKEVVPSYPPLARQAHIQGSVVLDVEISTTGAVDRLSTVSGHPMLIPAAIDAVKQWQYKPYLLNGEPVPVRTQVTVNFTLSSG